MHKGRFLGRVDGSWVGALFSIIALGGVAGACSSSQRITGFGGDAATGSGQDGTIAGTDASTKPPPHSDAKLVANETGTNFDGGCARQSLHAQFAPAAMLVVLDGSQSMAQMSEYATAEQAIIAAIDETSFNTAYLGLLVYPSAANVAGPACVFNLPVACGVPGLAQVPLQLAGTSTSSDPTGVRHDIYASLASSSPASTGVGEANPAYEAIQTGIAILQAWPETGKRILFYITNGGASCASLSTRPGYDDGNGCPDWEYPTSIMSLVQTANQDTTAPVNSIFVGVTGADTNGGDPNVPPYSVRLALSAEAWAGSPQTCPAGCNGTTFTQTGADPTMPCHFDMTVNYSPTILANAINQIRGSLLGCVFNVPQPDGGMVSQGDVNVEYTTNGTTYNQIDRRSSTSDTCMTGAGCWDYNATGQIILIGNACTSVGSAPDADVQIVVGCPTVLK
jgi:hypothetical protein